VIWLKLFFVRWIFGAACGSAEGALRQQFMYGLKPVPFDDTQRNVGWVIALSG
jgi:hypothetical protein